MKYRTATLWCRFRTHLFPLIVCVDDIATVRQGRHTEGLRKHTDDKVESRAFSILFKSRRKNLDLIASSEEEAKQWVTGLEKLMSNMGKLTQQQKTEQYPFDQLAYQSLGL